MPLKRYLSLIFIVAAMAAAQGCNDSKEPQGSPHTEDSQNGSTHDQTNKQPEVVDLCKNFDCSSGGECKIVNKVAKCVDKDPCTKDGDCINQRVCDKTTSKCIANACNTATATCTRGVCDPHDKNNPPACIDKATCDANGDCLVGKVCNKNHQCVPLADECKEQLCDTGSLQCDPLDNRSAGIQCIETKGTACTNKFDCSGIRICNPSNKCQDPPVHCNDDPSEPQPGSPKTITVPTLNQWVSDSGFLCPSDNDPYTIHLDNPHVGEKLLVKVSIDPRFVGVGLLHVKLLDPAGQVVGQEEIFPQKSGTDYTTEVTIEGTIGSTTGDYQLEITADPQQIAQIAYKIDILQTTDAVKAACANPSQLTAGGTAVQGDNSLTGLSHSLKSSCGDVGGVSNETIYQIEITDKSFLTVTVETDEKDLNLSLRGDCLTDDSEVSCTDQRISKKLVIEKIVEPGTYYAVVQGNSATASKSFYINYTTEKVICDPNVAKTCNGDKLEMCNSKGTATFSIDCGPLQGTAPDYTSGCGVDAATNLAKCYGEVGNKCATAEVVKPGSQTFKIDFSNYDNTYSPSTSSTSCSSADGKDYALRIEAKSGQHIDAELLNNSTFPANLYIIKGDCSDIDTQCVHQKKLSYSNGSESIHYDVTADGTYYLIADSTSSSSAQKEATLTVDLGYNTCFAGQARCVGNDLEICRPSEIGYAVSRHCSVSCNAVDLRCDNEANDQCSGAKDISGSTKVTGDFADYTNSYTTKKLDPTMSCATQTTDGPDAYYVYTPTKDELLDITFYTEDIDANLMLTDQCDIDAGACLKSLKFTKKDPSLSNSGLPIQESYLAKKGVPIYFVVDSPEVNPKGKFTIEINHPTQLCTPGTSRCDATDTKKLYICSTDGLSETEHLCSAKCQTSSSGATCQTADGTTCRTPTPLDSTKVASASGETVNVKFTKGVEKNTLNFGDGIDGSCNFQKDGIFSRAPIGTDKFYSVEVPSKHVVEVSYKNALSSTMLYLTTGCSKGECLNNLAPNTNGKLYYYNSGSQPLTVLIGFDHFISNEVNDTFDFTAKTYQAECSTPGESIECTGTSNEKIKMCNEDYTTSETICSDVCDLNSQHKAECVAPTGNKCDTAIAVNVTAKSKTIDGNLKDFQENYTPYNSSSCRNGKGRDAVYLVKGPAYGTVNAHLSIKPTSSGDTVFYAVKSCDQLEKIGVSSLNLECLASDDKVGTENITFHLSDKGEAIVVVDEYKSAQTQDLEYTVTFDKAIPPKCPSPGSTTCDTSSGKYKVCNADGSNEYEADCLLGCADAKSCKPENNDKCDESKIPTLTAGQSYIGRLDGKTNSYNAKGCSLYGSTQKVNNSYDGPDAYFKLVGTPGDYVDLNVETMQDEDGKSPTIVAGFLKACHTTCEKAFESPGYLSKSTLSQVIPASGELIVVVDSTEARSKGLYKLEYTTRKPECNAGVDFCDNNTSTLYECQPNGTKGNVVEHCGTLGCNASLDACNPKTVKNDTCSDALEVDLSSYSAGQSVTFTDDLKFFNPNLDPGAASKCVVSHTTGQDVVGNDAVYLVKAPVGKVLKVEMQKISSSYLEKPALYATTDCANLQTQCITGKTGSTNFDIRVYIDAARAASGVYVVADTINNTPIKYDIIFTIEDAECVPQSNECNAGVEKSCNSEGSWDTKKCPLGCNSSTKKCAQMDNTTCSNPTEITASTTLQGDLSAIPLGSATYDSANACNPTSNYKKISGKGAYYKVIGNPGDIVDVWGIAYNDSDPGHKSKLYYYAFEDCSDTHTCLADESGGLNKLSVIIPPSGYVYIGIDNRKSSWGTAYRSAYQITFDIYPPKCTANVCSGSLFEECSSDHKSIRSFLCPGGCNTAGTACEKVANDTCSDLDIPTIPTNATYEFYGDFNNYSAAVKGDQCGYSINGKGNEAIFKVHLTPDQQLKATVHLDEGSKSLWITDNCTATGASCLEKENISSYSDEGTITYTPTTEGDYYLIVDSEKTTTTQPDSFILNTTVDTLCTAGDKKCDGDTLVECSSSRQEKRTNCTAGCGGTPAACNTIKNEQCANAEDILTTGDIFERSIKLSSSLTNHYPHGLKCYKENASGGSITYKVTLHANDTINVKTTTKKYSKIFIAISKDCSTLESSGDGSCLNGDIGQEASAKYTNSTGTDQEIYIVIGNKMSYSDAEGTVTITRNKGYDCAAKPMSCTSGTLKYCDESGTLYQTYDCPDMKCNATNDGCMKATGDFPSDPISLTPGEHVSIKGGNKLNDFTPSIGSYNSGKCTLANELEGNEYIYKLELPDQKSLEIPFTSSNEDILLILLDGSVDMNQCLEMSTPNRQRGVLSYTNTSGSKKTLYLLVDSTSKITGSTEVEFSVHVK